MNQTMSCTVGTRARECAELIGERLASPAEVRRIAGDPANVDPVFGASLWMPVTLSHGHPGIATLFGELAREDDRWRLVAHTHLTEALAAMPQAPSNGLFAGPASVLAAAQTCSGDGRYGVLRDRLLGWLVADQRRRIAAWRQRRSEGGQGVGWAAYDVVNGLSGTGQLLLDALAVPEVAGTGNAELAASIETAARETVQFLAELSGEAAVAGRVVPGWWIPPEAQPSEADRLDYPEGDFNLGLAHGIPGVLAFLSYCQLAGLGSSDSEAAIGRVAEWVLRWRGTDSAGSYWPARVSWQEECGHGTPAMDFTRSAWCYGAPGVAVALLAAGRALGRADWQSAAREALHSVLGRDRSRWRLEGATLCHGYAGLVAILLRTAAILDDQVLLTAAVSLAEEVLDSCSPDLPFAVSHLVPDSAAGWRRATGYRSLNVAGLLEGAAGVGCALLDVSRLLSGDEVRLPASWARAMMLP